MRYVLGGGDVVMVVVVVVVIRFREVDGYRGLHVEGDVAADGYSYLWGRPFRRSAYLCKDLTCITTTAIHCWDYESFSHPIISMFRVSHLTCPDSGVSKSHSARGSPRERSTCTTSRLIACFQHASSHRCRIEMKRNMGIFHKTQKLTILKN